MQAARHDTAPSSPPQTTESQDARALRLRTARLDVTERRRITAKLRQALNNGGLVLHYQPIISLASGLIQGAEAQLRLRHKRRGLISAAHILAIAERSDIATDLGAWMCRAACADAATWPARICVAIGLSPRHLQSGRMIAQIVESLAAAGLPASRLEFELSEAILTDLNDDTSFNLRALQSLGIRLALNNFGTGYASLSALKRLPVTTLRLDRSLIQNLAESKADIAIVHAAIEAGHALGCIVLADGVESEAQFTLLGDIGCDQGQGAYFNNPVATAELAAMLG